jgi:hypothetical protein
MCLEPLWPTLRAMVMALAFTQISGFTSFNYTRSDSPVALTSVPTMDLSPPNITIDVRSFNFFSWS